jgi:ankyrin repeat protein
VAALLAPWVSTAAFAAHGQVNDQNNRPVAGAWVVATRSECRGLAHCTTLCEEVKVVRTDEQGKYAFWSWFHSLDDYQLTVYREGHAPELRLVGPTALPPLVRTSFAPRFSALDPAIRRIAELVKTASAISCFTAPVEQRAALVPVYRALFRDANALARFPEQKKKAQEICDELFNTQMSAFSPSPPPSAKLRYLQDVEPACNLPIDDSRERAILAAISSNDREALRRAASGGFDLNRLIDTGEPPIISAALAGSADMVSELAALGAKPDTVGFYGRTALERVAVRTQTPQPRATAVLKALLEAGADANRPDMWGYPPLVRVAGSANPEMFDLLLEHGARVNQGILCDECSDHGKTALHSEPTVAQALAAIRYGANVNVRTLNGNTPLMFALHPELVKVLLEHGADPNLANRFDQTPLMRALESYQSFQLTRYSEIAELLVAHGARLDVRDQRGMTPLDFTQDEALKARLRKLSQE